MKINNPFFKKKKNIFLSDILKCLSLHNIKKNKIKIFDIKDLNNAGAKDISFFNSIKYLKLLKNSKVKYVITHKKYEKLINKICNPILVDNVLKSVSIVSNLFYPTALNDAIDFTVSKPNNKLLKHIKFGRNVLIGKNVKIGSNSIIGHNTIIESNVKIGSNCTIGNNVLIKNSLIGNYVRILDGTILGKKRFWFFT